MEKGRTIVGSNKIKDSKVMNKIIDQRMEYKVTRKGIDLNHVILGTEYEKPGTWIRVSWRCLRTKDKE